MEELGTVGGGILDVAAKDEVTVVQRDNVLAYFGHGSFDFGGHGSHGGFVSSVVHQYLGVVHYGFHGIVDVGMGGGNLPGVVADLIIHSLGIGHDFNEFQPFNLACRVIRL